MMIFELEVLTNHDRETKPEALPEPEIQSEDQSLSSFLSMLSLCLILDDAVKFL